jgi:hypothetical protein
MSSSLLKPFSSSSSMVKRAFSITSQAVSSQVGESSFSLPTLNVLTVTLLLRWFFFAVWLLLASLLQVLGSFLDSWGIPYSCPFLALWC